MRIILALAVWLTASLGHAAPTFTFDSIDGGALDLSEWRGKPVLVVNTASRCAYTRQYDGLQALYDAHRDDGLVVLAVPSNDFRQELASDDAVKDFCEVNFGLDMPMTTITSVRGDSAHPFYQWVRDQAGFEPAWNFNKVLIAPDGSVAATFGSNARPQSKQIAAALAPYLQ